MAKQFNPTLNDLLRDQLGLNVHPKATVTTLIGGAACVQVLKNNPNRVGLTFINLGANDVYIWLDNTVSSSKGILMVLSGGNVSFNWRDDMTLNSNEWWAIAPAGNTNLSILEMVSNTITEGN